MDSTEDTGIGKMMKNTPLISPHYLIMMAGRMMPLLALFGATILYAHQLPPDSYAGFQSIWMYTNLVSVIMGFGVTIIIFSSQAGELVLFLKKNRKTIFIFYSVLWTVTLLIFALAARPYSLSLKLWVVLFMALQASNTISETWLIRNGGEVAYFAINIIYGIAFFAWHYLVLYSGFDLEWLVKGIVSFAFVKLFTLLLIVKRSHVQSAEANHNPSLRSHWIYNGVNDIISILSKWIDKLILIYLLTPAEFAIFFTGSIEIPLLAIFVSFTGSLMMVQMAKRIQKNESMIPVFRENFLLLSTFIFPVFFFFLFFRYPIFHLIFGPQYDRSVPIFLITILILPLRINNYGSILQVLGKGKIITKGSVIDLILCILFVFLFFSLFGMRGAAMAIVLSTIIQVLYYLWHSKRLLQTTYLDLIPLQSLIIRFLGAGISFWLLHYLTKTLPPLFSFLFGCVLILAYIVATGNKYYREYFRQEKTL